MNAVDAAVTPSRWRARVGMVLAPAAFLLLFAPLPLEPRAHRLAAIFAAVAILWVTEALPVAVTALAIAPLLVIFDVADPQSAFRWYADPLLFLFVGGFFIAKSMQRHGLDRRIAGFIVSQPWAQGSGVSTRAALCGVACIMSMWISNTATCAMLVPILLGVHGGKEPRRASTDAAQGGLLSLAYVCSAGGIGTLVGTTPNLIAVRLLTKSDVRIGFVEWLAVGVPVAFAVSLAAFFITARVFPPRQVSPAAGRSTPAPPDPGVGAAHALPLSRGEKTTALAFALAVIGWVVPDLLSLVGFPGGKRLAELAHPGAVAILASLPLFLVRDNGVRDPARLADGEPAGGAGKSEQAVLPWSDGVQIDWGVIMLFGGGISLGRQLVDTGLAQVLSRAVVGALGPSDVWALTAICCVFTIAFTEICSNTASTNMLVPLVIAIAGESGVSPVPPTLAVALAASCAFMLPIATGPNAIVYGTGRIAQVTMMRTGFFVNIAAAILIFALLRVLCPLLGWG